MKSRCCRRGPVRAALMVMGVALAPIVFGATLGACPNGITVIPLPTPGGDDNDIGGPNIGPNTPSGPMVVFGYNELGMHCMNEDFSEFMILPPYNSLHAQVIARGEEPRIVTSGVTIDYAIPGNTTSVTKTNFWTYASALLGVNLAPDVGLASKGLTGRMEPTGQNDWVATGIPLTPLMDSGQEDSYQLGTITVTQNGVKVGQTTNAVVPVSWEISCNLCHNTQGISTATDILRKHDQLHGTSLEKSKPVLCGGCHAQAPLGLNGVSGVPTLSRAMHSSHAPRMSAIAGQVAVECYACHPGIQTKCLRDVHFARGMDCKSCHNSMEAVADPNRHPWVDEPRCGNCHSRQGFQFEQANTLFRNSKGHSGVHCEACHGAPHAITPTVNPEDNAQAIALQGHSGPINTCTVCHTRQPEDSFFHRVSDD
jgi:hypothetical protein